jgi:hypothetical protein
MRRALVNSTCFNMKKVFTMLLHMRVFGNLKPQYIEISKLLILKDKCLNYKT